MVLPGWLHDPTPPPATGETGAWHRRRLQTPTRTLGLTELARTWFHAEIEVACAMDQRLVCEPVLLGRLRGAFGDQLLIQASPALFPYPISSSVKPLGSSKTSVLGLLPSTAS